MTAGKSKFEKARAAFLSQQIMLTSASHLIT